MTVRPHELIRERLNVASGPGPGVSLGRQSRGNVSLSALLVKSVAFLTSHVMGCMCCKGDSSHIYSSMQHK